MGIRVISISMKVLRGLSLPWGVAGAFVLLSLTHPNTSGAASPVVLTSASSGAFSDIESPLVVGSGGNFYVAAETPSGCCGAIIEMTPTGSVSVLASLTFANGSAPNSLIQGSDGSFYGTATKGGSATCALDQKAAGTGCGTVFRVTPAGSISTLATFSFNNGGWPGFIGGSNGLVQASDGDFYGTTFQGGTTDASGPCYSQGCGTLFKVTPSGTLTTVVSFTGANGSNPAGGLIASPNGNLYGTTSNTVFELSPSGTLTTVGLVPAGQLNGVVMGTDGSFYGTAALAGGLVYKMTPTGVVTVLSNFASSPIPAPNAGYSPEDSLVQGSDGNFYGTTNAGGYYGFGTVFQMTPAGAMTTLFSFDNDTLGGSPSSPLTQGADGNLYGSTASTFFRLCLVCAAPPPRTHCDRHWQRQCHPRLECRTWRPILQCICGACCWRSSDHTCNDGTYKYHSDCNRSVESNVLSVLRFGNGKRWQ